MSYCRFSSDDWLCDVYVYEDVRGGWTTHVAGARHVLDRSNLPEITVEVGHPDWPAQYVARHQALIGQMIAFEGEGTDIEGKRPGPFYKASQIKRVGRMEEINLPHAGETFNDPTPGDCADRLEYLRSLGYHV